MNNREKNSYVRNQISKAMIELLKIHEFSEITISQITSAANVSRNSFYRNYSDKEDILLYYLQQLYIDWDREFHSQNKDSDNELFGSLFAHIKENSEFYLLLKQQNLFHLFLGVLLKQTGAIPDKDNLTAYVSSFITYGIYGWINEWIDRGMEESSETMTDLLSAHIG